jgi:metallophosphoesterase superfamily enzyme
VFVATVIAAVTSALGGATDGQVGSWAVTTLAMGILFVAFGRLIVANMELREAYPFCRLSGPANVLVMPAFHSASISTKMLQELGGATVIGPLLVGLDRPVQIVQLGAKDNQLVNMAALAAYNVSG